MQLYYRWAEETVSLKQSVTMDDGLFRFGCDEGNDNEQNNMIDTAKNDVGACIALMM